MQVAYLGIATPTRLLRWVRETEFATASLAAHVSPRGEAICFWTTLADRDAMIVSELLQLDRDRDALVHVQNTAIDGGRLMMTAAERRPVLRIAS